MKSREEIATEPMVRLSRLPEYGVERHDPDPRGWPVRNGRGQTVGEVKDLIVDMQRMKATDLDVELDAKLFHWHGEDRHVLIPVERVQLEGRHVIVPDITDSWVSTLCAERAAHQREFWDRWWNRGERAAGPGTTTRIARQVSPDELARAINSVAPGETVRIPVVNEEIVVERRPASTETHREEVIVNRAADEAPIHRR